MNRCLQIDSGGSGAGGRRNALSKVCGLAGSFDDSAGLLPSPGQCWDRIRAGIRYRTASMRLRLLRISTLRVCALRLLRAWLVCRRRVHRRRAVVWGILRPRRLWSGLLRARCGLLRPRRLWSWKLRSRRPGLRSRFLPRGLWWTRLCRRSRWRLPWRHRRWISWRSTWFQWWRGAWRRTPLTNPTASEKVQAHVSGGGLCAEPLHQCLKFGRRYFGKAKIGQAYLRLKVDHAGDGDEDTTRASIFRTADVSGGRFR